MAIRIGPPPVLARLRYYCHSSYTYYLRQRRSFQAGIARTKTGIVEPWHRVSHRTLLWVQPGKRLRIRRQAEFHAFVEHYEDLVGLLCRCANEGVLAKHDLKYAELREWMQRNYHRVRSRVQPHLAPWVGPFDQFEELFSAQSVEEMINDTSSLDYVMQTRSALEACMAAEIDLQSK